MSDKNSDTAVFCGFVVIVAGGVAYKNPPLP